MADGVSVMVRAFLFTGLPAVTENEVRYGNAAKAMDSMYAQCSVLCARDELHNLCILTDQDIYTPLAPL